MITMMTTMMVMTMMIMMMMMMMPTKHNILNSVYPGEGLQYYKQTINNRNINNWDTNR